MLTKSYAPRKVISQVLLRAMLIVLFILSQSTLVRASEAGVLSEVRSLIRTQYVEAVSRDILSAPTVEELLERLGDPHTMYFTPEQYQAFVGSIDMRFTGIGIHIEMLPEGVQVLSVISGSPAEEVGLKTGDVILSADGKSLAGLSAEEAVGRLRGLEGSAVQLRVEYEGETRDLRVTRRAIAEPTVTGKILPGHIGYLDINSFGSDTPEEFEVAAKRLSDQNVDRWIVDLRDNGGGYLSSALDLAGYFIGSDIAVRFKDRSGVLHPYQGEYPGWSINGRIMVLINENSASASEILAAALKDYEKATLIGTTSYGKGTVQSMFPLQNGGVLKMTVDHFYSPLSHEINQVGVSPNIVLQEADSLKAAQLLLADSADVLKLAQTKEYWKAWAELSSANTDGDRPTLSDYRDYYPSYRQVAELSELPLDKRFTVNFSGEIDGSSVNSSSLELINSKTGERMLTLFEPLGKASVQVIPQAKLSPDTTYWLVIHPSVRGVSGQSLQEGGLAVAHTIREEENGSEGRSRIQAINEQGRRGIIDYGVVIKDLSQ